jgi:hypothetical protein
MFSASAAMIPLSSKCNTTRFILEIKAQRKLHNAGRAGRTANHPERARVADIRHGASRQTEAGVVEKIEGLCAKFNNEFLADGEMLVKRQINA